MIKPAIHFSLASIPLSTMKLQIIELARTFTFSMLTLLSILFFISLLYVVHKIFKFIIFYAKQSIDSHDRPPITGTVFHQLFHFADLFDFETNMARRHKTFRIIQTSYSEIYTLDPINIEHTLKSNFSKYVKGEYNHNIVRDLFGDGIFAVDGNKWRHQRKLASYEFSTKVLRDFSSAIFRTNGAKLAKKISEAAISSTVFDMQDLLMKSTLDSIFKVGFGVELDTLSGSVGLGTRFSKAFDEANYIVFRRYVDMFWNIKKYFNIGLEGKLKKHIRVIDDFVLQLIQRRREMMKNATEDVRIDDQLSTYFPDFFVYN